MSAQEQFWGALARRDIPSLKQACAGGANINALDAEGATALFHVCVRGDLALGECLLQLGADPNISADEPTASMFCENLFDVVTQSQFLIDWETFTAIAQMLVQYGAKDGKGNVPDYVLDGSRKQQALEIQRRGGSN